MKILNINLEIVSSNTIIAKSFWDSLKGLINSPADQSMIFNTRFGLHTFFMNRAIDVLILDDNNQIKKIKRNLQPYNIFFWNPRYSKVIELPAGTIKNKDLKIAEFLSFEK